MLTKPSNYITFTMLSTKLVSLRTSPKARCHEPSSLPSLSPAPIPLASRRQARESRARPWLANSKAVKAAPVVEATSILLPVDTPPTVSTVSSPGAPVSFTMSVPSADTSVSEAVQCPVTPSGGVPSTAGSSANW